ncbi:MAG: biopolymer transporter ExbD [Candidatus Omnitrophica bacterium]|nr:biopolymer transporter ExbD [Candidatus Omnitrophota bacterium]
MKVYLPSLRRPRVEMIPLIDCFFLLLAFFMSSVLNMEVVRGLPVELPKAGAASSAPQEGRRVVTIGREGQIQLDGEPVSAEDLVRRLSSDPRREALKVGIRADQGTPYRNVVEVLGAVRRGGVVKVTLMTS